MLTIPTTTRSVSLRRILPLILCVAVFAWGMQYKLSLYNQPNPGHPKTVAKLFVDNQPGKKSAAPHAGHRETAPKLAFLAAALVLLVLQVPFIKVQPVRKVPVSAIPSHTYALFFRPPPFQA